MKLKSTLFIGVCLVTASQLSAAGYEARIFNQPSCDEWLELTSNGKKKWLLGFLSGMNHGFALNHKGHDPLEKITSSKQIFDWMDNYCKANPQLDISDGGAALFQELKNK